MCIASERRERCGRCSSIKKKVHQSQYSAEARRQEALRQKQLDKAKKERALGGSPKTSAGKQYKAVTMKSGDVLVFGGSARNLYHGVAEIAPNTRPPDLKMTSPGRLLVVLK